MKGIQVSSNEEKVNSHKVNNGFFFSSLMLLYNHVFIDLNCFLRWAMWPMGLLFLSCHSPSIAAFLSTKLPCNVLLRLCKAATACCGVSTNLPQCTNWPQSVAAFLQSCHRVLRRFYKAATAWCRISTKLPQRLAAFLRRCHSVLRHFYKVATACCGVSTDVYIYSFSAHSVL